jgi:tRNA nucleotidyltransferase/poly(A) polymerase
VSREGSGLRDELLRSFPELRFVPPPAWVVGGALRDLLLGRSPADVDIAAPAGRAAAEALASGVGGRIVPLGRERFPTWRVIAGEAAWDISDVIGAGIEQDLARRDFTINALALPLHGQAVLLDPFRGEADLAARRVRMVARQNLVEDPLRVLKAIRIAATLGFAVDDATLAACAEEAPRLGGVAGERIGAELEMMFTGGSPSAFVPLLAATRMDEILFGRRVPGWLERLEGGDAAVLWSAIFGQARSEELAQAAKRLRWPASMKLELTALTRWRRAVAESGLDPSRLDPILHDAGPRDAARLIALASASGEEATAQAIARRLEARGERLFSIEPLLDGEEIAAEGGIAPGPAIGRLKRELLLEQIAGRVETKEDALRWLRSRASS